MGRSILAIVGGVLLGGISVGLIELPGYVLHPSPPGLDTSDRAALGRHFENAPLPARLLVAVGWTIGPLVGGLVAGAIARRAFLLHGLVIGVIFLLLDVVNIVSFPHPVWLAVVGVV